MQWGIERLKASKDLHDYQQRLKEEADLIRDAKYQDEIHEFEHHSNMDVVAGSTINIGIIAPADG